MSKALFKSTGVVSALTLLSRILGLVRDVMLAAVFGGPKLDAFFVAQMIPNLGRRMFAEGAFSQAFIPVFTKTRQERPLEDVRDLTAVVMGTLGAVLSAITLVGCLAAPLLVWLFAPGFKHDPAQAALGASLLRWTFPYLMFISLTSMAGSILNIYGLFAIPAFTPVILNLCIIGSALIDPDSVPMLAYGVFVAGILQFLFQVPALARLRLLAWPRWGWSEPPVRRIVGLMLPVLVGSSVAQISLLLNTSLATLVGSGAVSWLNFGSRLMEFPTGIFSIAVGTVIMPSLSAQHAQRSARDFSDTLDWGLRTMLLLGVPSALGLVLLGGPLVATIFGHGRFGANDVRMTTYVVWAYGLGFMGFSLVKVLVPGFYARQETRVPVRSAVTALLVGMAASVLLFGLARWLALPAAHVVFAFSTSLTAWINSMLLLRRLKRDGVYRPGAGWGRFSLRLLAAAGAMSAFVLWQAGGLQRWLAATSFERAYRITAIVCAAAAVYFAALWVLGLRPAHFRPRAEPAA
ncbi:MAG: murein biosynthesis integral membrane protein MurJ [Nevskia sp.]|nr:murein biosynthesis integral membrane protein MurJ [Nevskia sp.]